MIRVGMIGCGGMGNYHGPELAKLPNVKTLLTVMAIWESSRTGKSVEVSRMARVARRQGGES